MTLIDTEPSPGRFHLDVVGPHEHHRERVSNPRVAWHGWLEPEALAQVYRGADVIVSPATCARRRGG